jgi:uncharacterized membrane protein
LKSARRRASALPEPVRLFAIAALSGGVALGVATPPGAAPDETRHLSRVYLMSEGSFGAPGLRPPRALVPRSIPELHRAIEGPDYRHPPRHGAAEMVAFLREPLDPERRVGVANAGTYPPFVYLPQLVGVAIGRWLELSPAALILLGRATGIVAWVALVATALALAPARRWTLALLSLTPMAVAGAASISADPMTSAAALLFTVLAVRAATASRTLAGRELGALLGAALFLGVVKPGYWPLALAVLAIPPARAGGGKRRLAIAAAAAAAIVVPSLLGIALAQQSDPAPVGGADPAAQLRLVLGDPLGFLGILLRTLTQTSDVYWQSFVGQLGPQIVKLPAVFYWLWAAALAAALIADGPPAALARSGRLWLATAFAASIAMVFAIAYLGWNPVGAPAIQGVQGRYWAPALPALVFALPSLRTPLPAALRLALPLFAAASLAMAVVAIVGVYYRI